jgi:hypothetical protein
LRLAFKPLVLNDDAGLSRAATMARAVLQALPQTPIQAIGINFGYKESVPPGQLRAMFTDVDDDELGQEGWTIGERKLIRRLTRGDDVLNLAITFGSDAVDFDFNYHHEAGTNAAALRAVSEGHALALRDTALAILREVYHLELEEHHDDDHI